MNGVYTIAKTYLKMLTLHCCYSLIQFADIVKIFCEVLWFFP